jgi:SNF2 family DNA or RNA helicase
MLRYDLELGETEKASMKAIYTAAKNKGRMLPTVSECAIALSVPSYVRVSGFSGKIKWFQELIQERIEGKCVVYSPYLTVIREAISVLDGEEYAEITGEIEDKTDSRDRFVSDENCRFLFITDAGGRGLDGLQRVARHMVFLNLPISSGQMTQVVGRLYRIGGQKDIVVHVPIVSGSIDEDVYQVVQSEFHLVRSTNPEQLIEPLVDDLAGQNVTFDEMGSPELWLKEKIKNRNF